MGEGGAPAGASWITGLIDPGGLGSRRGRGQGRTVIDLNVSPWREGRGPLVEATLHLEMRIERGDWFRLYPLLGEGTTRRFRVRFLDQKQTKAELLEVGPTVRQVAFDRVAREREKPIRIKDDVLGRFTFQRGIDRYATTRSFRNGKYTLSIRRSRRNGMASDPDDLRRARPTVERIESRHDRVLGWVAREMLPLYNDTWRGGRKRLTRSAFLARIRLESVDVLADHSVTMYFKDGGLFHNHLIEVRLDSRGKLREQPMLAG